ncbi:hypothetical protein LLH23_10950 [bacterium]|nr:hypothetical protein [bacterium]
MKFLLDTNILIPLDPTNLDELRAGRPEVTEFCRLVQQSGHHVYVHPAVRQDLARDADGQRRALRERLVSKYPTLGSPPVVGPNLACTIGSPPSGSNDWVDDQHLAAVVADAVDYLVTNDGGIHGKAARIGLADRVLRSTEALEFVARLFDRAPLPPPAVASLKAFSINDADPIFGSFRSDYPEFDAWLRKVKLQHRQAWVIQARDADAYAAVCIVNQEKADERFRARKTLKICSFKVSDDWSGLAYGELLLRTVFDYAHENGYECLFVTAFPRHEALIGFLLQFGFERIATSARTGEDEFTKDLVPHLGRTPSDPFEYHVRYGPFAVAWDSAAIWVIPIQPRYHRALFPGTGPERPLLAGGDSYGNSIRKAYLSRATRRDIRPGDILLFYRSQDQQALTVVGVAERTLVSTSPEEVAAFVGKRTVYSYAEIGSMCMASRAVTAILFRHAHDIRRPIRCEQLVEHGLVGAPPQSIQQIKSGDTRWLRTHAQAQ